MAIKIMLALNSTWNLVNFRSGLMYQLLSEGYELIAVSPKDEYVDNLKKIGCEYVPIHLESKGKNIFQELNLCMNIYKLLKLKQPDVVLSYTIKPNLYFSCICHLLKIPIINTVTGLGTIYFKDDWLTKVVNLAYKLAFKKSKKVFFQNHEDLSFFLRKKIVSPFIVDVIPGSGVDLNKFRPVPPSRAASHNFQFLFVGRVLVDKGVLELIEATKILKEKGYVFQTAIVGSLDPNNKRSVDSDFIKQSVDRGLIDYFGSTDDVRAFISQADCIVLPSYREGISRALLEAASMAKPIISTFAPGCRDVVDDGVNGYLCHIKDPVDLSFKMEKILQQSYEITDQMGQNGRKKVEREFNETIVISRYLEVVRDILES